MCNCGERHHEGANYYVSVVDGPQIGLLYGPCPDHAEALVKVEAAKKLAKELNQDAIWFGFGTVAMSSSYTQPGLLNKQLGYGSHNP